MTNSFIHFHVIISQSVIGICENEHFKPLRQIEDVKSVVNVCIPCIPAKLAVWGRKMPMQAD